MTDEAQALIEACRRLDGAQPRRLVPSPSSVDKCTRRNWFVGRGVPPTNWPDGESYISRETGRASEPLLRQLVEEAGLGRCLYATEAERECSPKELARMSMAGGQVDNLLETPDGDIVLIEFKRKGIYGFLGVVRKGVREGEPDDYTQVQALMCMKMLDRGLYIAANYDRSSLTKVSRGKERPCGIYTEWVRYNKAHALATKARAEAQTRYIREVDVAGAVPRDHDPFEPDWQCQWCYWWQACKDAA